MCSTSISSRSKREDLKNSSASKETEARDVKHDATGTGTAALRKPLCDRNAEQTRKRQPAHR